MERSSSAPPSPSTPRKKIQHSLARNSFGASLNTSPPKNVNDCNVEVSEDLMQTLQDPELCNLFRSFLKEQYAGESLSFWAACEQFKSLNDEIERDNYADEIWRKFFSPSSEYELNVDGASRRKLESRMLERPSKPDLFDAVQKEVFELLETDCYYKFIRSKTYDAYQEKTRNAYEGPSPPVTPKKTKRLPLLGGLFKKKEKSVPSLKTSPSMNLQRPRSASAQLGPSGYNSETMKGLEIFQGRSRAGSRAIPEEFGLGSPRG